MPVKYIKMLCFSHENHHFDFLFYIICELQKTKVISLLSFILVSFILTDEGNKSFILHPRIFYPKIDEDNKAFIFHPCIFYPHRRR